MRHGSNQRRLARNFLVVATLVFTTIAVLPQVAHARRADCWVRNARTGATEVGHGPNLQRSIDAAEPRDTLLIKGHCIGTFSVGKTMHLVGKSTQRFPQPILDANDEGSVLTTDALLLLDRLTIKDGKARCGGGIFSTRPGRLVLGSKTVVVANQARRGGGVCAADLSVLDNAQIRANHAGVGGGGIAAIHNGTIDLRHDSVIRGNRTGGNGGGVAGNIGFVRLREHATIRGNRAAGDGGGIAGRDFYIQVRAFARIVHNVARGEGGAAIGMRFISVCPTARIAPNRPNDPPSDIKVDC